jgi:hypothetical protein
MVSEYRIMEGMMNEKKWDEIQERFQREAIRMQRAKDIRELREILAIAGEAKVRQYLRRIGSDITIEELR